MDEMVAKWSEGKVKEEIESGVQIELEGQTRGGKVFYRCPDIEKSRRGPR